MAAWQRSGEHFAYDMAMHVGEPALGAIVIVRQPLVVEAK
jgi:hypothetical protein